MILQVKAKAQLEIKISFVKGLCYMSNFLLFFSVNVCVYELFIYTILSVFFVNHKNLVFLNLICNCVIFEKQKH